MINVYRGIKMRNAEEIKFDFGKIDEQILVLQKLQNRAVTCSTMKLSMPLSRGDAKEVLLDAHEAMATFAGTVAIMLKDIIDDLNYSKIEMKREDETIARKMMPY